MKAMTRAGGMAAKKAAEQAASRDLGGDRRMSGLKRGGALSAGFDLVGSSSVKVKYRPAGAWVLADQGRKRTKLIVAGQGRRKGAGGVRLFRTPDGPRRSFMSRPSRGLGTIRDAKREAGREVPKAAQREFRQKVTGVF